MPKTRKLTGIAALSAASLASVAVSAPANADPVCDKCDIPGLQVATIKFDGQYAYNKLGVLYKVLPVDTAYFKLGLKFEPE